MYKKVLALVSIIVAFALLLTACAPATPPAPAKGSETPAQATTQAPGEAPTEAKPATGGERVKIRWYVGLGAGSDQPTFDAQKKVVEEFNASQDKIELVLEIVDNKQAYDTLATQISAGNPPDIVGPVGIRGRDSFKGAWLDLQPLVDANKYDLTDFDPAMVDFYKVDGELLGLPFAVFPSFLHINKDLFDEAGLPYPPQKYGDPYVDENGVEKEWNMDTLKEIALKLTVDANGKDATSPDFDPEKIEQFGFGIQYTDARGVGTLFGPGTFVGSDGKAQIPAQWSEGWKWVYDGMWKSYFMPNGPYGNSDLLGKGNWFQSGHIAIVHCHLWYSGCCMGELKDNWDTAVVPSYNGKTTAKMHADTFEIMKGSKHPQEAFEVITYLLGPATEKLTMIYGGMPARISLQQGFFDRFGKEKFPDKKINWQVVVDSLAYADNPNHESWMPSFQETSDRYTEFWTRAQDTPDLNLDAEIDTLQQDLQRIFDAAKK